MRFIYQNDDEIQMLDFQESLGIAQKVLYIEFVVVYITKLDRDGDMEVETTEEVPTAYKLEDGKVVRIAWEQGNVIFHKACNYCLDWAILEPMLYEDYEKKDQALARLVKEFGESPESVISQLERKENYDRARTS